MPAIAETYSLGLPVEIGRIDQELKKLWQESKGAATRASLINLAVYCEEAGSLNTNTQLMARIAENHACRAIVIEADCKAKENRVDSWISAHCHVSRAGSKQVCSEQISFLLKGTCTTLLPSIVFSHLDSDLPFYLWWQEEFREPMDPQLWAWVDRVIYDSWAWDDFRAQMHFVESGDWTLFASRSRNSSIIRLPIIILPKLEGCELISRPGSDRLLSSLLAGWRRN